ncbi:hypothetical protein B0T25DRAFT_509600 [Lasiosphaeria hispida]|uniref:Septation initiation network scaffold protein cdc11 n=1 Tax=Lasiosphaeria hispida TaxID=260671 RepID=A0AAJ0MA84_9PEZI|nr:hypothetical protein B0T25DRAFT_509600 [Lasiosphaeria hispida]
MASHAWLDSLSEDWVSQPASEASIVEPAPAHDTATPKTKRDATATSRIPRLTPGAKQTHPFTNENSSNILSERSVNEIFVPGSRRTPSKLSQEVKVHERGRYSSRSLSVSTSGSVVHNTVQHKSQSASPTKRGRETPEWRKRLVYGDLSYGEQRDLFTSRGTGLENIFKPPPAVPDAPDAPDAPNDASYEEDRTTQHEATLPSSPPVYERDPSTVEIHVDESIQELPERIDRKAPIPARYRRSEESHEASMDSEPSIASDSCSQACSTTEQTALSAHQPTVFRLDSRKVSNRSDVRHEDFSPILLERRQASNGKTSFGPADVPPEELRKRLEKLRRNQMLVTGEYEPSGTTDNQGNVETTEVYERLGGFINFRRGGRSGDGSFRHHQLSSNLNDTSELLPEESLQASTPKQFPSVRIENWEDETEQTPAHSPDLPPVPNPSPDKRGARVQGASGSPLKLFQPYDTFTNQTLLRRLSQFQGGTADDSPSTAAPSRAEHRWEEEELDGCQSSGTVNQFGAGQLDGYEFNDEFSYQSNDASELDEDKENDGPSADSAQAPRVPIFDLSHDSSPSEEPPELSVPRKRQKSITSMSSRRSSRAEPVERRKELQLPFPNVAGILSTPKRKDRASEIKRPRTSPSKDPTPKRRRTLHKSDIAYGVDELAGVIDSVQLSHQQMQSIIGRKRKDARHGDSNEFADPDVLANRQMLRPRTPTPTQRPSTQRERPPLSEIERSPARSTRQAQAPAPLPLGSLLDSDRKPSIKTEDFINEANKIMAMIRSKAGLASGLASLEESDAENGQQQSLDVDSSYESTQEPFSRPPSREGRPPLTRISTRQEDPELVERLKMYEEASDMGDIIGSSVRSVALAQEAIRAARERTQDSRTTMSSNATRPSILDGDNISDPPNMRISHNPDWQERQSADGPSYGVLSQASSRSSGQDTGRSIPTGSSRGSENRKVIVPESVSHLIPDQVGNMVLDRQRNIWIKRRKSGGSVRTRTNFLPSEASEDDPFADIPDLTVDMTLELQNLRLVAAQDAQKEAEAEANGFAPSSPPKASKLNLIRMSTLVETSAGTSTNRQNHMNETMEQDIKGAAKAGDEPVEHEIGIDEDRGGSKKRRNLTISFSSPVASIIQDTPEELEEAAKESIVSEQAPDDFSKDSMKRGRRVVSIQTKLKNASSRSRSRSQGPSRHLSVRGQTFVARPISRIDERDEESVLDKIKNQERAKNMELSVVAENSVLSRDSESGQHTSLSFVVTTPARPRDCSVAGADAAPIISQYVGTLSLSPLSEFTMHHGEESLPLEASYIVGEHRLVTGNRSKRVMSLNTRDLVGKIAEAEPFEPYWEDMRELELQSKRLESLHALHEFCARLESLDVSNNEIRNLNGIPSSVRHLKMANNQLSGLTAWDHLMNLQYVDVSGNGLTSLTAFKGLVHLRSLRVDNNQLTSLDGIKFHDGLQSLRARGNAIEELGFDGNRLHRLADLDLKNNKIKRIINLEQLPALDSLNLEGNQLENFEIESERPLISLRYLRLDDNKLSALDLKMTPHVRLLHADRNCLSKITGFSRARRIDSLSLREQRGGEPLDLPNLLSRAYEVRKLYLSGNLLEAFAPAVDLLNLQLLELANCGLQSLPENLGLMLPNLRVLNINLNAMADLSPLRYIPRLKRIFASGNRLADSAALVETLAQFPHLTAVDVRDNPVTQGFYAPVQVVVRRGAEDASDGDPFALPDQDAARDQSYAGRLDMETRIRRRLHEQMFAGACRRVKKLDGLPLKRKEVEGCRDAVWAALAEKGFVVREDGGEVDVRAEVETSGRWPAEDSFA